LVKLIYRARKEKTGKKKDGCKDLKPSGRKKLCAKPKGKLPHLTRTNGRQLSKIQGKWRGKAESRQKGGGMETPKKKTQRGGGYERRGAGRALTGIPNPKKKVREKREKKRGEELKGTGENQCPKKRQNIAWGGGKAANKTGNCWFPSKATEEILPKPAQ